MQCFILASPNSPIYVPCRFLELLHETDYSGMTISEIKAISGISPDANTQEIIPTQLETSLTKTSITEEINGCTQKLSEMEDELHDIRRCKKKMDSGNCKNKSTKWCRS